MSYSFEEFAEKLGSILLNKGIDLSDFEGEIFIKELEKVKQAE